MTKPMIKDPDSTASLFNNLPISYIGQIYDAIAWLGGKAHDLQNWTFVNNEIVPKTLVKNLTNIVGK